MHALAHVYNVLRAPLKDFTPPLDKDWFRSFYLCCCAAAEGHYRLECGLPEKLDPFDGLAYHALMDIVRRGESYPDVEWQRVYEKPLPRLPPKSG